MLVPLVLAVAVSQPPAVPAPLSPENLPPPPTAAKPAEANSPPNPSVVPPYCLEIGGGVFPPGTDDRPGRAVAAIAVLPGFRYAAAGPDGVVRGYTDDCRVIVLLAPGEGRAAGFAAVASRSRAAAERAKTDLIAALGRPETGASGRTTAGTPDPDRDGRLPPLDWHRETRPFSPFVPYFSGQAALALARQGYAPADTTVGGTGWASLGGTRLDGGVVAATVMNYPAPDGIKNTAFMVVSTGPASYDAAADVKTVCRRIVHGLYD